MNFFEFLSNRSGDFIELGVEHAAVVGLSVALATLIGVSVGIATYQSERPRELVLAVAGVILTVPSFALFVLLLGPLGLGWQPVLVALTGYVLLPILRNTITGLRSVDPAVIESAQAMGMNRRQQLLKIELPLAWPVIITGIRVTTLVLLGIAAIGAVVNGPGYGEFIFEGLRRVGTPVAVNLVLAGMVGVMVLAVLFDLLFYSARRLTTSKGIR